MGAPTGTVTALRTKPWRGYPSVNAVHGIRAHIQQDPAKYAGAAGGLTGSVAGLAGHFALAPGGAAVHIGTIPQGAIVLPISYHLLVAFAPTGNTLNVGITGTMGGLLSAIVLTTPGFTASVATGTLIGYQANTIEVYAQLAGTAQAGTAGEIDVLIPFYIQKD